MANTLRHHIRPTVLSFVVLARDLWRVLRGRGCIYAVTWAENDQDDVEFGQFPGTAKRHSVESMVHDRTLNPHKIASLHISYRDEAMPSSYSSFSRTLN